MSHTPTLTGRGCKCFQCRVVHANYMSARKAARKRGEPGPYVPREQYLALIHGLIAAGWTRPRIAAATGMTVGSLHRTEYAVYEQRTDRPRMVRRYKYDRLRALRFPVTGVGVARRLQALVALGHPACDLADVLGVKPRNLWPTLHNLSRGGHARRRPTQSTVDAVLALYADLSMTLGNSQRARNVAVKNGWAPPLAWDDDEIDNPDAKPAPPRDEKVEEYLRIREEDAAAKIKVVRLIIAGTSASEAARLVYPALNTAAAERRVERIKQRIGLRATYDDATHRVVIPADLRGHVADLRDIIDTAVLTPEQQWGAMCQTVAA